MGAASESAKIAFVPVPVPVPEKGTSLPYVIFIYRQHLPRPGNICSVHQNCIHPIGDGDGNGDESGYGDDSLELNVKL